MCELYDEMARVMRWSADCADTGYQRKVEWRHPTRGQIIDRRDGVERTHPGRQAPGRGRVAARAVSEPERRFLEDARRSFDVHPVHVVVVARRPVGGGIVPDAVDMFELNARLTLVDPVDREADGSDMPRLAEALRGVALGGRHPLVPGGGDLVEHDAGRVGD